MGKALRIIVVSVTVATVSAPSVAQAADGGRGAAACSNLTVNAGKYGGKQTLRFALKGHVSCSEAHHVVEAFYRKAAANRCGFHNMYCNLQFSGGWDCSFFFATESKETGGAIAGCARSARDKVRLYTAGHISARSASRSCGTTHLIQGGSGARVTIVRGSFSCAEARGIVRLYGSTRGVGHYLNHGRALSYATYPGGWVCGALERGYARCFRGGLGSLSKGLTLTSVRNARDVVELFLV
jgi:hypothetical protein